MSAETQTAPQWVQQQFESSDYLARERQAAELNAQLPGIHRSFEDLIELVHNNRGDLGEFPVAASIVRVGESGKLETVSTATNQTNHRHDSLAHAETIAIQEVSAKTGEKHLSDHWLLSTLEPCVQCCGAAVNSGLKGVIYSADHDDVTGKSALVDGEYKKWRTSPQSFDASSYLAESGLTVVRGFMRDETLRAMQRTHGDMAGYYRDPDA